MRVVIAVVAVVMLMAAPAFAQINFNDNDNDSSASVSNSGNNAATAYGGAGGSSTATGGSGTATATTGASTSSNSIGNGINNFSPNSDADADARATVNNDNQNMQGQGQLQGQGQDQQQGQQMGQGQVSVGQVDVQDNSSYKSTAYSFAPPSLASNRGMNEGNIYSIFGGIGLSEDSEYIVCMQKLQVIDSMVKAGLMPADVALVEAEIAFTQLKDSTKPRRVLWVGPKTRGRHIGNFFGLIATDSARNEERIYRRMSGLEKDAPKPVKEVRAKTVDKEVTGNAGYINN